MTETTRPRPPGPALSATDPPIRIRGLLKRYGELTAVYYLDLKAAVGEVFALLGPERGRQDR